MSETNRKQTLTIVGFLLAGAALLGLGMCTRLLQSERTAPPPPLRVLAPAPGAAISDSLVLRFVTTAPLELSPHGWAAGDLHPHVLLDGREFMAGASDITAAGDTFAWRLPLPPPGEHSLLLTWAARHHGTVGDTAGRTISFRVR